MLAISVSLMLSTFIHTYYEYPFHWIVLPGAILFGALVITFFFFLLNESHIYAGLSSNIHEINAILDYYKFQNNRHINHAQ